MTIGHESDFITITVKHSSTKWLIIMLPVVNLTVCSVLYSVTHWKKMPPLHLWHIHFLTKLAIDKRVIKFSKDFIHLSHQEQKLVVRLTREPAHIWNTITSFDIHFWTYREFWPNQFPGICTQTVWHNPWSNSKTIYGHQCKNFNKVKREHTFRTPGIIAGVKS